jgi:hypothetical protein
MTILCDGAVPLDPADWSGGGIVCKLRGASSVLDAWRDVFAARFSTEAQP